MQTVALFACYAGTGLGKDEQGMAQSLSAMGNKGKAGLGLDSSAPHGISGAASYALQPDAALLINSEPALTMQEMEWWRIMEQRRPKKLLRSKFLPQDDTLLALRSAREQAQGSAQGELYLSTNKSSPSMCSSVKA